MRAFTVGIDHGALHRLDYPRGYVRRDRATAAAVFIATVRVAIERT